MYTIKHTLPYAGTNQIRLKGSKTMGLNLSWPNPSTPSGKLFSYSHNISHSPKIVNFQ